MTDNGWNPETWGDEREQRVIFEGMTLAYRCNMYFLMFMMLVMYAAGEFVFGFVTLMGGLAVSSLVLGVYTRRRGVRMNDARFRKMGKRGLSSLYSPVDAVLTVLFVVVMMGVLVAQEYLGRPLFEVWHPSYEDAVDASGLGGLISGSVGAIVGMCCAYFGMWLSRRAAARRVSREDSEE